MCVCSNYNPFWHGRKESLRVSMESAVKNCAKAAEIVDIKVFGVAELNTGDHHAS